MMTTQKLVTLMNELACLNHLTRSAVLTALNHPTVENVQRAIASNPVVVERFIAEMFDEGCPVLFEAPLWLHAAHGLPAAVLAEEADAMEAEVATETALRELVVAQAAIEPPAAVDAVDTLTAVPDTRFDESPKAFRVVRLRDGVVASNVTRVLTLAECQSYLTIKGTKSLAILDVAAGRVTSF
jgi:hypothetical protein